MKKYLLIVVAMMAVSAVFAFQPSSMLIGGTFEFKSEKDDSDADAFSTVAFYPQLSGFVIENLSADLIVNILSQSTDGYKASSIGLGAGARYFFRNLYGGADFTYAINNENEEVKLLITTQKTKYNAMYLTPKIGYLAPSFPTPISTCKATTSWAWANTPVTMKMWTTKKAALAYAWECNLT